jgi:outer membrane biosynthesis protein TonB
MLRTRAAASLREQLRILRVYAEPATRPESGWTFFLSPEVTEKAYIIKRPEPRYPPEARSSALKGKVKVLLTLAADETVKTILVLKSSHPPVDRSLRAGRTKHPV